jgi:metal-responsive CopG/Arc/MetJ family transcriptional regulator
VRTTIEMKPEHRSALLALAGKRGQKGFSELVSEAIEEYLRGEKKREQQRQAVLSLAGTLSAKEAEELRSKTEALRNTWR